MENKEIKIKIPSIEQVEIPEGGSLGLLAYGYIGLILWRKKRQEVRNAKQSTNTTKKA